MLPSAVQCAPPSDPLDTTSRTGPPATDTTDRPEVVPTSRDSPSGANQRPEPGARATSRGSNSSRPRTKIPDGVRYARRRPLGDTARFGIV